MLREFISFMAMNQGWVGTIVATAVALLLYWRSQIPGIIAFQSRDVPMIGGSDAVFPAEIEVQYRGAPVSRIISSTVWIWNAGKKTVSGTEIVAHDPLQLRFDGKVLNVRIKNVSRKVVRITAATTEEVRNTVCCGFEFLDPGDGGVLEVLHTGSDKAPECTGTIRGLPKGPQDWGYAVGAYNPSPKWKSIGEAVLFYFMGVPMVLLGLGLMISGIYQGESIGAWLVALLCIFFGGAFC